MWAVVEIDKKQYLVNKGGIFDVERLKQGKGNVAFDKVLIFSDGEKVQIGTPYLDKIKVKAEVQEERKSKKVIVYKYKRRKRYCKKQGHRQIHTRLKISDITTSSRTTAAKT